LRRIREQERHETRAEFAEAMARIAREIGASVYPDAKYVERLESGDIRYPGPAYRRILTQLCHRQANDLGFAVPGLSLPDSPVSGQGDSGGSDSVSPGQRLNVPLRDAILASGLEVTEVARKVGIDPKSVQRWITTGRIPHTRHRRKACEILGREESELWPEVGPRREAAGNETATGASVGMIREAEPGVPPVPVVMPTPASGVPDFNGIELLRQEMNNVLGDGAMAEGGLDDWERTAIRYARATRDRPASVLLSDISRDLAELNLALNEHRSASAMRRLTRVMAQMSGLMCLIFCILDDRPAFRRWARTARLAGNEAGDPETLSWVLAQEAYGHYYSGDLLEAIDVARHAHEIVRTPCTGAALAAALEARAHAAMERPEATKEALARAESILSQLSGDALIPSAFGYNEASFRFHEGNAYTHLRDVRSAFKAQDRALELCNPDNYTDWALTRLDRAQCHVYSGDVSDGLAYATATMTSLTEAQRRGIITLRGQEIVNALPEGEKRAIAARDFNELLMLTDGNPR
jgi:tetratricopeptide (TPR) repeat protein